MNHVVSIINQKGGVGKTTTAINLAYSLSVLENRVLLIDADPQANSTSHLGFDPKKDMPFTGTRHNALDDSKHQAKYVSAIYKRILESGDF